MGIDIYLEWDGMKKEEKNAQATGFSITSGNVGYLREAYHGGPYATRILVREAFEAENCRAQIPAEIMRDRLNHVTEPAARTSGAGHQLAEAVLDMLQSTGVEVVAEDGATTNRIKSDTTRPMTVEEAVRERQLRLYGEDNEHIERVVKSFRDFVELAEEKERQTGKPCTVYASY
jgi:hypothetical protein